MGIGSCIVAVLFTGVSLAGAADQQPKRTTIPIGGTWNLTAKKHERVTGEDKRVRLLTSTGEPTLKHGANVIKGPWDIEAKAQKIECDFAARKFVLTGSPELKRLNAKTGVVVKTVTGESDAKFEVTFDGQKVSTTGKTITKPPSETEPGK